MSIKDDYLFVELSKNIIYCPICLDSRSNRIELHSYSYYKCSSCSHVFCEDSERVCKDRISKYYKSFYRRESFFVQKIPTKRYFEYYNSLNSFKINFIRENAGAILDCNKYISNNENLENSYGSSFDKTHFSYYSNKEKVKESIFDFHNLVFDLILCFDFIEYSYCLLDTFIFLKSIKSKNSVIYIGIEFGNDIRKNYKSRIHEFSKESSLLFASKIKASKVEYIQNNYLLLSC